MRPFAYSSPAAIDQALTLIGSRVNGETRPLAGGTDLLTLMKADITSPATLVDITRINELDGQIREDAAGIEIGTLTTLSQLEASPLIGERYPALAEAVAVAATPQLRNMATIGGNLLQRPRCWYFRNPHIECWLKGGETCPARTGENQLHALFGAEPCVAVHPSDLATALVALAAEVRSRGPDRERTVAIDDFFALPTAERRTETVIDDDELIVSIRLPALPPGTKSTYLKAMDRKVWAFAVVGVAATMRLDGRRIEAARLVLGGVAPVPHRARAAEDALIGAEISDELISQAAALAVAGATPLSQNGYKVPLVAVLIRRALGSLAGLDEAVS
ncbi:MAG: xanthine dehydrogenase family protein subunit M [Chloroflexota bacterium]|nr:xanthine dehydrogenase family protein subunit M [Chloroflexota bacterium]